MVVRSSDYDYELPQDLVAQTPAEPRDSSRLLVVHRADGQIEHRRFHHILAYLRAGDLLVANDSRVIPARLYGRKPTGGRVEVLLLHARNPQEWEVLLRGRGLRPGARIEFTDEQGGLRGSAEIVAETEAGGRVLRFDQPPLEALRDLGQVPLPPYIHQSLADWERYQTVYSRVEGSAAAPTAGLHFTPDLMQRAEEQGARFAYVTLHIGLDTFRPVQVEDVSQHKMHSEYAVLPAETTVAINHTRSAGGRVIAVGTTAVRVLETAASGSSEGSDIAPFSGWTDLFIAPGYRFRVVDALITNFHLPRSTLLMLVSAFASKELIDRAYQEAIRERYRFYSFGDAMLIL